MTNEINHSAVKEKAHMQVLQDVTRKLSRDLCFPTFLDLAIRVHNTLKNPAAPLEEIAQSIVLDPLMASRILCLANSPERNPSGKTMARFKTAIERLGLETVRVASLDLATDQIMKSKHLTAFDEFAKLNWEHSIRSAIIARELAQPIAHINPDEAMFAGLVHDIGIYYLFYCAGKYNEYRDDLDKIIELVLGWHEDVGESVLRAIGIPENICLSVLNHDRPRLEDVEIKNLSDIVYVANLLAGSNWEWLPNTISPEEMAAINKSRWRYASARQAAENDIKKLLALLRN